MPANLVFVINRRGRVFFLNFGPLRLTFSCLFSFVTSVLAEQTSFELCLVVENSWGTQCSSLSCFSLLLFLADSLGYPL